MINIIMMTNKLWSIRIILFNDWGNPYQIRPPPSFCNVPIKALLEVT